MGEVPEWGPENADSSEGAEDESADGSPTEGTADELDEVLQPVYEEDVKDASEDELTPEQKKELEGALIADEIVVVGRRCDPDCSTWIDPSTGMEFVILHIDSEVSGLGVHAPDWANAGHWFIETPTNSFGMGPAGGTATAFPPGGSSSYLLAGAPVAILSHDQRVGAGEGVSEIRVYGPPGFTAKVDEFARSESLGHYVINGTCQNFIADVLTHAGAVNIPKTFGDQSHGRVDRETPMIGYQ
jgi:hypothetical protein